MIVVTTTNNVPGHRIVRVLGLVRGNSVRALHVGRDLLAFLRGVTGGEVPEYTKLMAETREQAIDRMLEAAEALQANAIVGARFITAEVAKNMAELLAYGTAVVVEKE